MLKVYKTVWCPHCSATIDFLRDHNVPFEMIDMDHVDPELEARIVEVNGGEDWVVPTLEYRGKWRPGEVFNAEKLREDLKKLGIHIPC